MLYYVARVLLLFEIDVIWLLKDWAKAFKNICPSRIDLYDS